MVGEWEGWVSWGFRSGIMIADLQHAGRDTELRMRLSTKVRRVTGFS